MTPIHNNNNYSKQNKANDWFRTRYAEEKLRQDAQRLSTATMECQRLLVYLRRLHAQGPGSRLLDLGCGTGRLTIPLAQSGYNVSGTDINGDIIDIARDKAGENGVNAHFNIARAEVLSFSDATFDICIVDSVLEHVTDWEKTIEEVARVLKPGGIAYFDAANALYPLPSEIKYIPFCIC